jgi:Spy/CpxP family protein refolding chaperone
MMEMLMEGITLSDAQKMKVDSINTAFRAQMPAMTPGSPPDSATREKMREAREKQYVAIRTVLTAEQQTVFDKNLQELRSRMPGRPQR